MTWNELLNIILIIYIVLLGICAIAYVPRMRAWFYGFKKEKHLVNDKQNKIAVLIPARNESKVIVDLLNSAKEQTYPADKFDLHIIVKEANDPTIEITKKYRDLDQINNLEKVLNAITESVVGIFFSASNKLSSLLPTCLRHLCSHGINKLPFGSIRPKDVCLA